MQIEKSIYICEIVIKKTFMKKILVVLVSFLAAIMSINLLAQDPNIVGVWEIKQILNEKTENNPMTMLLSGSYTFNPDSTATVYSELGISKDLDTESKLEIKAKMDCPLKWSANGSELVLKSDPTQIKIEITEDDIEVISSNSQVVAKFDSIKPQLIVAFKENLKLYLLSSYPKEERYTIVELTSDTLIIAGLLDGVNAKESGDRVILKRIE